MPKPLNKKANLNGIYNSVIKFEPIQFLISNSKASPPLLPTLHLP